VAHVEFQDPQHPVLSWLLLTAVTGGLLSFAIALGDGRQGLPLIGLVLGGVLGLLMSLPKRWQLDDMEFRQSRPRREAGRVPLAEVRTLEAKPRIKGGYDLWLVPVRGSRVSVPAGWDHGSDSGGGRCL
jgi:hypothetical protein